MTERKADMAVQVRQFFDTKASTWSAKYAPGGRLTGRLTRFASALSYYVPTEGQVLDLGCGTGELACAIATAGMRVTGCDISLEMLHRAAAADTSSTVDWVQLDPGWRRLPFELEVFDAVVAASVLEYVGDPVGVLRECCRVLRPGGVVLCTVPDLRHPVRWLEWLLGLAGRVPVARSAGRRWTQLDAYMTYLRSSRQRHSARWWYATAASVGLDVRCLSDSAHGSPLRLLTFQTIRRAEIVTVDKADTQMGDATHSAITAE